MPYDASGSDIFLRFALAGLPRALPKPRLRRIDDLLRLQQDAVVSHHDIDRVAFFDASRFAYFGRNRDRAFLAECCVACWTLFRHSDFPPSVPNGRASAPSQQTTRAELFGRGVDAVDGCSAREPLREVAHPGLQVDLRLVGEQLARARDVGEAVADVSRAPPARRLRRGVRAHDPREA